ncbi:MAG: transcription termination/antitermination protein NusG [Firmicutes bacterium]|nr:transcription termination/antitermination protein NusG [Bacillota bacterium]MCL1953922.1 transcription termination/antitermination protein NusG [Bacillota bacterium]
MQNPEIDSEDIVVEKVDSSIVDDANYIEPVAAVNNAQISTATKLVPHWYILHTYVGYENMVKDNLEKVFEKNNLQSRLLDIKIPDEEVYEEKNGKRKLVKRRMFPTYVFIKMEYDNSMWHMITKTRGITGFVGPLGRPLPLSEEEIKRMRLDEQPIVDTNIVEGDQIRVVRGSFEGNDGVVSSLNLSQGKAKIKLEVFGRLTDVEIDLNQIEKL